MEYNPREIEKRWRQYWVENQVYKVSNDSDKPKFYVLDMFPYPSGSGLHVGHPLGYIASDIFARYKRLKGFNVLHPMGYDAFGLPAEQYAIDTGVHPADSTEQNIRRYRQQLDNIGFSFDWSREVRTSDPSYYKWTQWIFLQLFDHYYNTALNRAVPIAELVNDFERQGTKDIQAACSESLDFTASDWKGMRPKEKDEVLMNYRLAYRKTGFVNWCEALGTVLANDEVKDGVSERGGFPVERKPMLQWSLRITAYAERLLNDLDDLEWTDSLKTQQRNWIGRSEGATLFFEIKDFESLLEIFTTRADTIFGATFMVLAPEHPYVDQITTPEQREAVEAYRKYVKSRSERDRMSEIKEVTGAFTGAYALNPFNQEQIPIWIGEYVLMDYGTGAIMAVPSDDERDMAFAKKFDLPIIDVVDKSKYPGASLHDKLGVLINSDFLNGMEVPDAIGEMFRRIEEKKIGKKKIQYKLRDANYSRQRYWGEPFPIVYDPEGVSHPMPLEELPLVLPPSDDFKPASGAKSPLARISSWVELPNGYTRETDTMPGFAGSSWYFLRYMDALNEHEFASQKAIRYWQDVDLYVGGTEHAVGHLMYSRCWHKFLFDKGLVPTNEPFRKLINQGMIQGVMESIFLQKEKKDGHYRFVCAKKLAQSGEDLRNFIKVLVPIEYVQDYGAPESYFNRDSVERFLNWRPEYQGAVFETLEGDFRQGILTPHGTATDFRLVTHSEVGKMSKSKYNVINPDDVVETYGADCFRMYEMFLGPIEQAKPWDTKGIDGVSKFLRRFWSLFLDKNGQFAVSDIPAGKEELKALHACIKKVTEDIERFSFNTCVSAFMVCANELKRLECNKKSVLEELVVLMAPFAPHISEELWHLLGHEHTVQEASYPIHNPEYLVEDSVTYPVSINGKKRADISLPAGLDSKSVEESALGLEVIQKWIEGQNIKKVIVVPGRMINIVI